ncbi:MAG: 4Fe-4S dicluster domain-containing protein [Dehalococcoidia bacterium]|jgi:formate dehydrogenase iron-sulfur subunit
MAQSMCLIDASKCIGCRACQVACKQWNQLPAEQTTFAGSYENPPRFSSNTWCRVVFREHGDNGSVDWLLSKQGCMHCTDAACMQACPAGAIYRTAFGTVNIDQLKCIGCNYCVVACPFGVIGFDRRTNKARKCTFCIDRLENGLRPACATACPTGSITFGDASDLVPQAIDRVDQLRAAGKVSANVYGLEELGGTAMLYVLADEPEKYGLPADPEVSLQTRVWDVIFKPVRAIVVVAVLFGLWVTRSRSKQLEQARTESK